MAGITGGNGVVVVWQAFLTSILGLVILTVLTISGDVSGEVSIPIIAGIVGAATGAGAQKALNGGTKS